MLSGKKWENPGRERKNVAGCLKVHQGGWLLATLSEGRTKERIVKVIEGPALAKENDVRGSAQMDLAEMPVGSSSSLLEDNKWD